MINHHEENLLLEQQQITINEYSTDVTTMTTATITKEEEQQTIPEDQTELIETQKQLETLRETLKSTNGSKIITIEFFFSFSHRTFFFRLERLVSMENICQQSEERYRSLQENYEKIFNESTQLKQRSTKETIDHQSIENHQNQVEQLSKRLVSKQSEHDQLLSIYLCFFLSCYLLIFFLFFCLLSW